MRGRQERNQSKSVGKRQRAGPARVHPKGAAPLVSACQRGCLPCERELGCGQLRCSQGTRLTLLIRRATDSVPQPPAAFVFLFVWVWLAGLSPGAYQSWHDTSPGSVNSTLPAVPVKGTAGRKLRVPEGCSQLPPAASTRLLDEQVCRRRLATDLTQGGPSSTLQRRCHKLPLKAAAAARAAVFARGAPPSPPLRANVMAAPPGTAPSRRSALCH